MFFLLVMAGSGCIDDPVQNTLPGAYQQEFELLWNLFDEYYVGFALKEADWDYLYDIHYDSAADIETREEMTGLELQLLSQLQDPRVKLISPAGDVLFPFERDVFVNCDSTVLMSYLDPWDFHWTQQDIWGYCFAGPDSVPYFVIRKWDQSFNISLFDNILQPLQQEPFLILDVRMASGSFDGAASNTARRFVPEEVIGHFPNKDRTHLPMTWLNPFRQPSSQGWHFEGDVVLLAGEGNGGTSEMFLSDMSQLPSVVLMGDTSQGSGNWQHITRELPEAGT